VLKVIDVNIGCNRWYHVHVECISR